MFLKKRVVCYEASLEFPSFVFNFIASFPVFSSFFMFLPLSVSWECGSFSKNDSTEIYPEIG
ncbi:hypothetical protein LEP1GSC168_3322 [Leptospira santarosai str. HAI134]|nr:hypothetical protein LEP1GSC169_2400 [Leptospira santarosai str. HAI1349]EMO24454.1 hypothetical protein LEP1GSC168_3322 [Leptospira santarosai str. HAI134]